MQRIAAFLITGDAIPALVDVRVRASETAPGRSKVALTVDLNDHPYVLGGNGEEAPLPPQCAGQTIALCEFRLEMN